MPPLCAVLVLFSNVYGLLGKNIVQPHALMTAQLGDTVTVPCFDAKDDVQWYRWLKQPLGQKPEQLLMIRNSEPYPIYFNDFINSTRLSAKAAKGSSNLTVSQVEPSDSATYYCAIVLNDELTFGEGTTLMVLGSESHGRTVVLQQPESESVQPGDSATLQCTVHTETCAGDHSVYWFRQGSGESPPGIIYTHGTRSDECQRSSGAVSPTQSCVYNFPKKNLSPSDAGTYYCAVATCGEILFGNGTKLDIEGEPKTVSFIILSIPCVALALSLIVIAALLRSWKKRKVCEHCTGNNLQKSRLDTTDDPREQCSTEDALNYAALRFSEKNTKARPKRRDQREDLVYSDVRTRDWS